MHVIMTKYIKLDGHVV